jgi:hypothetical protein
MVNVLLGTIWGPHVVRRRTTRTSTTRPHGACTLSDQERCLLLRPGGQRVAGSNPVVPTR